MKIVDIKTKIIPSNPRSKNYPIGYPGGIASNSNGVTPDLSIYLLKEIWERNFEERTDEYGNEYLYIRKPLAIGGGATMYASNGVVVPSIFDGLPLDNTTIRKNPETGLIEVIGGTGSSFDENAMWSALSGSSDNQINKSHLTMALEGYATRNWVIENYATKSELSAVSNKLSDFLEGSDTDNIINKWKELEAFLSGMAETDNLAEILETKADKKYVDSTFVTLATKQTITGEKTFSSVLNTAAIKASGEITTPSLAVSDWVTIAGIKLRKLEDGALMLEGNLALTGALTMYASNGQSFDTIYDGLPIDNDTIYWQEVDGSRVLKAREGSGSSFDKSAMWTALAGSTTEQINKSHLTTALTGYATESWVTGKNYAVKSTTLSGYGITDGINAVSVTGTGNAVTAASISGHTLTLTKGSTFSLSGHKHAWSDITSGKPTTLSGYGITDAYTKTDADSRYVNVSGDTMTGNLSVKFSGRTDQINLFHSTTTNRGGLSLTDTDNTVHAFHLTTTNLLWKGRTVWDSGNDGSGSGLDADLLDGTHKSGLLTALTSSSGTNISITVGGTTKSITDLYAYASTKLETARTLWGRSFDGTANVSGNLDSVGNITLNRNAIIKGSIGGSDFWKIYTREIDTSKSDFIIEVGDDMDERILCRQIHWSGDRSPREITLMGYSGEQRFIDIYINGIRLHKTADGVITLEGNLAVTGGVTTYAIDPVSASTIMDGVVVDGTTIKKENGKLVAVGGGEAGSVAWGNITGKPSVFATNIANITDLHSSWDSVLAAQKPAWLTAVSIATISDLNSGWDALLKAAPSAYVTRWPTISEVTSKQNLVVKLNGGTTEGTNQFTYNATAAKSINITASSVGAAASSHNHSWSNITSGKPTTLAGYGITDAPTKTGSGASGTWGIGITGNAATASKWATARTITLGSYLSGSVSLDGSANVTLNANVVGLTSQGKKTAISGTTFPDSGLRLYQVFENGYPTNYGNLLSINGGGGCGELLLAWKDTYSRIYYRSKADTGNDSWTGWNTVAFLTDNVASATNADKLDGLHADSFLRTISQEGYYGIVFPGGSDSNWIRTPRAGIIPYSSTVKSSLGTGQWKFGEAYIESIICTTTKASNWFRSTGETGWLNETYGGGWYMTDGTWIRAYANKSIAGYNIQGSGKVSANSGMYVYGMYGSSWGNGDGAYEIQIPTNEQQTPVLLAYNASGGKTGSNRYFAIEVLNSGNRNVRMLVQGQHLIDLLPSKVTILKDLLVEGGCTFYESDQRAKNIIGLVDLSLKQICEAPTIRFRWNGWHTKDDGRNHVGGIAQYIQGILPEAIINSDKTLSMDYATVAYTFAVHTARHLLTYETRTDKKIKKLEREIVILKKQLKKLGYEEVRTLDDSGI